ncbi:MAG: DUF4873 domain-containing protein [Mycolicibacterium hassiacum]|nr:DUF4873 domain-containing protein [Mycolicibacterium hassiacum]PZN19996.1 MAG: DUF4873 domain-containing protein [Mycolicibacterium hassiacum]
MAPQRVPAAMTPDYDGPAQLRIAGEPQTEVRARLTGHLDPIDGRFHWRGMVFGLPEDIRLPQDVAVIVERCAEGRLTERTPWGSYIVAGVGAPPYQPLEAAESSRAG